MVAVTEEEEVDVVGSLLVEDAEVAVGEVAIEVVAAEDPAEEVVDEVVAVAACEEERTL